MRERKTKKREEKIKGKKREKEGRKRKETETCVRGRGKKERIFRRSDGRSSTVRGWSTERELRVGTKIRAFH